ncbi:MAG: c-type cytochrome [Candidatus Acidiferrales bacterium]
MSEPVKSNRTSRAPQNRSYRLVVGLLALLICMGANRSWFSHVPASYRRKANPYAGQADAIAAGHRLFLEHCAQCHQADAMGKGKRPSLRSDFVQHATDGEIFWVLRNGILSHGMPSWSMLPGPERWQIITYVKSLGTANRALGPRADAPQSGTQSALQQGNSK